MNKRDIINKLIELNIEFNAKALKADLEALLPKAGMGEPNPTAKLYITGYEASYVSKGRKYTLGNYPTEKHAKKALAKAGAHNIEVKQVKG